MGITIGTSDPNALQSCVSKAASKGDEIKEVARELYLLKEWTKKAEEKRDLNLFIVKGELAKTLQEVKIDRLKAANEIKTEASLYSEKSDELKKNVEEQNNELKYKTETMKNFLLTVSSDFEMEEEPGDENIPVNYEGEPIQLAPAQQRIMKAMFSRLTLKDYGLDSLAPTLVISDQEKESLKNSFTRDFREKLKLVFWHYRRIIEIRPSFRAEIMHLELSLRNRHYMDALQISIKLFKDDAKTFELVANIIKVLGGIPPICKECPEVKVWNYFFDFLSQQFVPEDFPMAARPRVENKKKLKEELMVLLREQVEKAEKKKPIDAFIKSLSRKVAKTKVAMNPNGDGWVSSVLTWEVELVVGNWKTRKRIADMADVFEYTLRKFEGLEVGLVRPLAMNDWEDAPPQPDYRTWWTNWDFRSVNVFDKYGMAHEKEKKLTYEKYLAEKAKEEKRLASEAEQTKAKLAEERME